MDPFDGGEGVQNFDEGVAGLGVGDEQDVGFLGVDVGIVEGGEGGADGEELGAGGEGSVVEGGVVGVVGVAEGEDAGWAGDGGGEFGGGLGGFAVPVAGRCLGAHVVVLGVA